MEPAWRIGRFTFEPRRHVLRACDGDERRIEPKAAVVLMRLVEGGGRVVTKQELFDAAWPGLIVTDEVLPNAIYQIRRALDDDARSPRYVETIPKVGYRLVASVTRHDAQQLDHAPPEERPVNDSADPSRAMLRPPVRAPRAAVLAGAVLLLVLTVALTLASTLDPAGWRAAPGPTAPSRSIGPEDLVARGWAVLDESLPGAGAEATALASAALRARPDDVDAWALLAESWCARAATGEVAAALAYGRARRAAARALAIDPDHPGALRASAAARWLGEWDWRGAESDLAAALEADSHDARSRARYAELLLMQGRTEDAQRAAARAVETDPRSIAVRLTAGLVAWMSGDLELAARHYRTVLARRPDHPAARASLAKVERPPAPPARAAPSEPEGQEVQEERLAALAAKGRVRAGHLALWFAEAGRPDEAFEWLDRAIAERDATVLFFRFDPRWDRWRDHPRYRTAMATAGLPPRS
jgi:DNA-binding winged helix-turn-helix (wHTH) protein